MGLGWLALMVPEEYGGLGGTIQDAIVLQEKLGKGMVVEPFFSTVILSANLINKAGSSEQLYVDADAVLGQFNLAADAVEETLAEGIVALSAEAVGVMETLLEKTNEYVKTRKQFDRAIGSFQVIQHRLADMFIEKEMSRSMPYYSVLEPTNAGEAKRAASMLKVKIGNAGRLVGQSAVQLHGGMGISDELDVGHYKT